MLRPSRLVDAPLAIVTLALVCTFTLVGCASEIDVAMRQPIAMGPWTFDVHDSSDRIESRGGQQLKIVSVYIELHNYEERHEQPFDNFINGYSAGAAMAFPHLKLQDQSGTTFDGMLTPSSGGSLRSRQWRADFVLVPSSTLGLGGGDGIDYAPKYLDTRV